MLFLKDSVRTISVSTVVFKEKNVVHFNSHQTYVDASIAKEAPENL